MADRYPDLPPLPPLRTFEAVARHGSFTAAAEELHVTQSAVSHQIRSLEEHLDTRLFRRLNPGIELTEDGRLLLEGVREGLDRIFLGAERVRSRRRVGVLNVSAPPSFATWWLVPRLGRFAARHPFIEVRVAAMDREPDPARDGIDVAVSLRPAEEARLTATRLPLLQEEIFPVCSPRLIAPDRPLARPEDLLRHVLLHEDQRSHPELDWDLWLRRFGLDSAVPSHGPRFSHFGLALSAAIDGQGVVLGRSPMIDAELAAGRLVRPFGDLALKAGKVYVAHWRADAANDQRVFAFREFLLDEACGCELAAGPCGIPPSQRLERESANAGRRADLRLRTGGSTRPGNPLTSAAETPPEVTT